MKIRAFRKMNFKDDRVINQFQDNVEAAFRELQQAPFLRGNLIEGVEVTNAVDGVKIAHGLEAIPIGYIISEKLGVGDVWMVEKGERYLTLKASVSSVTLSIWVF